MKISVIQMNCGDDREKNLDEARDMVGRAVADDRPDMVVLPETFAVIGGSLELRRRMAEPLPNPDTDEQGGPAYECLRGLATEHGIFVHGGSFMERAGDDIYNTTVAFDRLGGELARYRKIHRFDVTTPDGAQYRESDLIAGGDRVVTYDADGVTVGCTICYDLRFAELFQALARAGATVIMVPSAFTLQTGKDHWEVLLRARAIETETYVAAAGQTGPYMEGNKRRVSWGHSMIVDPWGQLLAQAQDRPGHASASLDMDYLAAVRARLPVHDHRVL
ncbi:MAG: carbon-nitrogen hydrolase family protein [Alphaproteobacteria bacterium]|nr:carbon-nitrogen hydrolase family protein [Alphaproteobacteria bacterium]